MLIRDTGSTVSFMINANNGSTFNHDLPWGYTVNGTTNNSRQSDYSAGAGWVTLGSWTVTTDQTVTFRLFDTGTSGLGGPTTFSVAIDRASAPSAPTIVSLTASSTQVVVKTSDGANNGAAIDSRQIGRNTQNIAANAVIVTATGLTTTITGPPPGSFYYFWARTHNAKGYSPWSAVKTVTLLDVPDKPDSPIISDISQTSFLVSFVDGADNGGSPILERQIVYNTVDSAFTGTPVFVEYTGIMTVTGLQPATNYYVWSRVRNASGWSSYSVRTIGNAIRTVAGARINDNGVWKEAIPYVKDGGTWKLARPWGRVAGVWKQST